MEILERPEGLDYDIEVVGPEDEPTPLTRFGRHRLAMRGRSAASPRRLAPGEAIETTLFASRIVDMSELGNYRVRVVRRGAARGATLTSNELQIEYGWGPPPRSYPKGPT